MAVLREAVKKDERHTMHLRLREECKLMFFEGVKIPRHKFVCERRGNTCLLVYFIDGIQYINYIRKGVAITFVPSHWMVLLIMTTWKQLITIC